MATPTTVDVDVELPSEPARLHLTEGVDRRPQALVDKQHR